MSNTPEPLAGRLTTDAKRALLDRVRSAPAALPPQPKDPAPSRRYDTDFRTLPGYNEFEIQRAAADALGIGFPFYRTHDTRAGAHTALAGRRVVNFASYDYLGLNGHPAITDSVSEAARRWGTSVSASRLVSGQRPFHAALEQGLAALYAAEDALAFVSGHATAVSTIAALMGPADLILYDALAHNCIVVGAQLSGAAYRSFAHNDLDSLNAALAASRDRHGRVLIVTEGLFSMDGDGPDLARLVEIKDRWGCWLMVDDAHGLGTLGATGKGIAEHAGVDPRRIDIWFGTLSKTLVSCGGYIAGPRTLVDYLKLRASGMVYSVGLPATAAVAAATALDLMAREPERVARLRRNGRLFLDAARAAGLDVGASWGSAITPVIIGDSVRTVLLSERLLARGFNAAPIIPPAVPEKSARLRFFLSADHDPADLTAAVEATRDALADLAERPLALNDGRLSRAE